MKAIIFDVDGTLADTEDAHRKAFNDAFVKAGLGWRWDRPLYKKLLSVTGGKQRIRFYLETHLPAFLAHDDIDARIADLHRSKTAFFVERLNNGQVPLRPGIEDLILEARAKKMTLAIATTTTPVNVTALLEANLGADSIQWFACIGDGGKVPVLKPQPDVYHWVLAELGLAAGDTLALEDSRNGLVACQRAGVPCLIVSNDYTEGQDFTGALAVWQSYQGVTVDKLKTLHAKAALTVL
ncbi:MAG: HAD hydrolase-like protein [Rhodospirillales bacterium]|nr:HAD hydrolase-like protein [Rhodospirillales bacterium]